MKTKSIISLGAVALMLGACAQHGYNDGYGSGGYRDPYSGRSGVSKQTVGTVAGAIGGGVLGHNIGSGTGQTVATIAGTLLGGMVGSSIGGSLDRADLQYYDRTSQYALESNRSGQASTWRNPDSGHYGTITPMRTYNDPSGDVCREYTQTIYVGGKRQEGYGRACRAPDGTWQIVE